MHPFVNFSPIKNNDYRSVSKHISVGLAPFYLISGPCSLMSAGLQSCSPASARDSRLTCSQFPWTLHSLPPPSDRSRSKQTSLLAPVTEVTWDTLDRQGLLGGTVSCAEPGATRQSAGLGRAEVGGDVERRRENV